MSEHDDPDFYIDTPRNPKNELPVVHAVAYYDDKPVGLTVDPVSGAAFVTYTENIPKEHVMCYQPDIVLCLDNESSGWTSEASHFREPEVPCFVITMSPIDNTVMRLFTNIADAEHCFTQECQAHGVEPTEEHYDKGYMLLEDGGQILLGIEYVLE